MYNPTEFSKAETTFFFFYNGSSQGPMGSADAVINIDSSATSSEWSTSGSPNYIIQGVGGDNVVGRADAIMAPTGSTNEYSTFGHLQAQGNPNRSYTNQLSAWQDHPARTQYYASVSDEVLHIYADNTANVSFIRASSSPLNTPDFTIAAGRAVIGGYLA